MKKSEIHFLYVTFPKVSEAKKISQSLIELKLIACANILPKMKSFYMWNNKLQTASECVVLFKTSKSHAQKVEAFLLKNHSYQTPCVANIEIKNLNKSYRDWLLQNLK